MNLFEGFFLGLSTGMVCIAYCGPILVPYLLGEGKGLKKNTAAVAYFLSGRLLAYLLVGLLVGFLGKIILQSSALKNYILASAFLFLSVLLIVYGFYRFGEVCLGKKSRNVLKKTRLHWPVLVPAAGGFVTGMNICPPFLLAITSALGTINISQSIWLFFMFFLGTSVYFIPFPFLGLLQRQQVLKIIGKFAAILTGLYYFYEGLKLLIF
jgi:sulfite exporter TauE/SafE